MENTDVNNEIYDGEVHQNVNHIVEETKELIMEEPNEKPDHNIVTDTDIRKTVEFLNPDASSMESRG